jgi:hypothetical protein
MTTLTRRRFLAAAAAAAAGCGGPANAPVDPAAARDTLAAALDAWKRGDRPDALQARSPPVYANDPDWQAGAALKGYRLGDGKPMDASYYCPATLTVRTPAGGEATREVTYIVSTAPHRTVNRKPF